VHRDLQRMVELPSSPAAPLSVTTRSAHSTHLGKRASQTVSPGSSVAEYPHRNKNPKSSHARRRPGRDAPSDKHELCGRKFTSSRRRTRGKTDASPFYPVRSPDTLRRTPVRHPRRTLGAPSSDKLKEPSENAPLSAQGSILSGGWPKSQIPPLVEAGEGCYVTPSQRPGVRGAEILFVENPNRVYTKLGP